MDQDQVTKLHDLYAKAAKTIADLTSRTAGEKPNFFFCVVVSEDGEGYELFSNADAPSYIRTVNAVLEVAAEKAVREAAAGGDPLAAAFVKAMDEMDDGGDKVDGVDPDSVTVH